MEEAQERLAEVIVEADAGGEMVKVRANGKRQILSIELDQDIVDPDDKEIVEDLVVAGVNRALEKAEEAGKKKIQEVYKDILDRKSTRLNSSHVAISYAVFCLKKKINTQNKQTNIKQ